ncbi:hypothetical protein HMPREF9098_1047 [Kingella denitrificans ATCC 33394]|uniref:Uncharacterized protein n=1 Tax=Kingella denitrificans ATCC 33394 TaxID=888741 RepID=F0EYW3_9NEIS|nr:hypothetical protein HMPREF9098_1047 [Kingella denitrificans ATCC 33394]
MPDFSHKSWIFCSKIVKITHLQNAVAAHIEFLLFDNINR